jgi:hypothetical protein
MLGAWILITKLGYPNAFESNSVSFDLAGKWIPFLLWRDRFYSVYELKKQDLLKQPSCCRRHATTFSFIQQTR